MGHEKVEFDKRIVQYPDRYQMSNIVDLGSGIWRVTLTPDPGTIIQEGTPLTEANLNIVEAQYDDAIAEITHIHGLGKLYLIGDDVLHNHDAEVSFTNASYEKKKTIAINALYPDPSTLRIKVDIKHGTPGNWVKTKIYKNGAPFGAEQADNSGDYVTKSEDLAFADGDTIELWALRETGGTGYVKNFRVHGADLDVTLQIAIDQGDVGGVEGFDATNL